MALSPLFKLCQAWERRLSKGELALLDEKNVGPVKMVMSTFVEMELCTHYEMQRLLLAFTRIGPPSEIASDASVVSIEDIHRYLRIEQSNFTLDLFSTPAKVRKDYAAWVAARKKPPAPPPHSSAKAKAAAPAAAPAQGHAVLTYAAQALGGTDKALCVDFENFCLGIWLLTHYEMGTLTFNMVDCDNSGALDIDEIKQIVKQVYSGPGSEAEGGSLKMDEKAEKVMAGLDVNGDKKVSKEEFVIMIRNYHYLLFPAFVVQNTVRNKLFGSYIDWKEIEQQVVGGKLSDFVKTIRTIEEKLNGKVQDVSPKSDFDLHRVNPGVAGSLDLNSRMSFEAGIVQKDLQENKSMRQRHSYSAGIAAHDAKIAPK